MSRGMKNSLLLMILVLILNALLYGIFLRSDITFTHPWRQTDSQAEIAAYAKGSTDFFHPVVNAPLTQWGPGVIEIPLPIFQYISAKIANLLRTNLLAFTQPDYVGPIKLPIGIKPVSYLETKKIVGDKVIYELDFEIKPSISYKLVQSIRPDLANYLHLYLIYNQIPKKKLCVSLINRRLNSIDSLPYREQVSNYCLAASSIPIMYLPIALGKNQLEFIFPKANAPVNLSNDFKIFSETTYAIPELIAARLVNILIVSAVAIVLACTFFPEGSFRIAAALSFSFIPAFGFFAYFIHEEILAFLFVSIFLWFSFRKGLTARRIIFAAISLGLATAIRPYYGLYGILLAALAFNRDGMRIFLQPIYYFAAIVAILPALTWYSWTQYLVRHGADTIAIFNNRIIWSSLLKWNLWKEYLYFFVHAHFTLPILLEFIVIFLIAISLHFYKAITFSVKQNIFFTCGFIISLIILPLVFDSAAFHNYYQFPVTAFVAISALICFLQIYLAIKDKTQAMIIWILFFGIIFASGATKVLYDFSKVFVNRYDPMDFAVLGSLVGELFVPSDKLILLGPGEPQVYGMTNRYGRRDAGYYSTHHFVTVEQVQNYLLQWYGPIEGYQGLATCASFMHYQENYRLFQNYVNNQFKVGDYIRYNLDAYPHCEIIKFIKH